MNATLLYRIASVVLLFFCAGHTFGFLKFKPPTTEGQAVREAMNAVTFQVGSKSFTYAGFYTGFGLSISVYLLFSAFLAWHLGGLAAKNPPAIGALGWVLVAVQAANLVLSWIYFFPVTVGLSVLVTACLAWAAWLAR